MPTPKPNRNLIHIITRYSNWRVSEIKKAFHDSAVYADRSAWKKFLELFPAILGFGLFTTGIFFFFAYNWQDMLPNQKFILLIGLIVLSCVPVFLRKIKPIFKQLLITVAALLVGALWAVFGQIYQTGADTFDYFLIWFICILIWVIVSDFPILWLVASILLNLTVYFYFIQDTRIWETGAQLNLLFIINAFICILVEWLGDKKIILNPAGWFTQLLAGTAICFLSAAIITGIYDSQGMHFAISVFLAVVFFPVCIAWGFAQKSITPVAIIGMATITILTALILKPLTDSAGLLLFTGMFFLGSTTGLIIKLVQLNKKWNLEN